MKRKTVKTAFKNYGIFEYISKIYYSEIFRQFSPKDLDSLYLSSFGKKSVSDLVLDNLTDNEMTETGIEQIATILNSKYGNKWERLYSIMSSDLKLLENYQDTVKETIHDTGENDTKMDTTNVDGNVNKVSAFNNDDFVNKESDERTQTGTNNTKGTNKNDRVREVTKTGYTGGAVKEYQSAINYLQNDLIYDIIFTDVNTLVTLQIFDI